MRPVILCVDDEKIVLDSLSSQLRLHFQSRFDIVLAGGVEDAWEVINELKEDGIQLQVIISDWLMPPHRGDQFLHEVYSNWPEVKLIMLSGQADEEAIQRVQRLPSLVAYLKKPWDKEEMIQTIERAAAMPVG